MLSVRDLTWSSWAARGRERDTVLDRERDKEERTEKYISNILMLKKEQVDTMKQALKGKKGRKGTGTF